MSSQSAAATTAAWARLLAVLVSRAYRTCLLTLAATAIAPLLFGYGSFVIKSGSMEPAINVGDVVVARPFEIGEKIAVGRVYVFNDPGSSTEHLLTHRIVEKLDDGTYVSAGDDNEVTDATPVTVSDMEARAVVLAPFVGLPVAWLQAGEWVKLALWLLLTIAAFVLATRNLQGEPPRWNLVRLFTEWHRERPGAVRFPEEEREKVSASRRSVAPAVLGIALALAGTGLGTANAAFTARTTNGSNTWTVGQWAQPYVSAVLTDRPTAFWLLDEKAGTATAQDRSGNNTLGSYKPAAVLGQAGGLPNNPGTSIRTAGGLAFASAAAIASSTTHTIEFWVRSSSTTGGYLTGFGSTANTTSPTADRIVRMNAAGRLTYGDWATTPLNVITTPAAYNNNAWHHVVVVSVPSSGGRQNTTIYVDGVSAASGQTSKVDNYTGYFRIGGGSGGPALNGNIDNVSVYDTALSAARVTAHWIAR